MLWNDPHSAKTLTIVYRLSESVNKRLSEISSDKECFDKTKSIYKDALNKSVKTAATHTRNNKHEKNHNLVQPTLQCKVETS